MSRAPESCDYKIILDKMQLRNLGLRAGSSLFRAPSNFFYLLAPQAKPNESVLAEAVMHAQKSVSSNNDLV
jgi:hypothetical protein